MSNFPKILSLELSLESSLVYKLNFINLPSSQYPCKFVVYFLSLEKLISQKHCEASKYMALSKFIKSQKIAQKKSSLEPP